MSQSRRSFLRTCGAIGTVGVLGVKTSSGASTTVADPANLKREQARFIAKFASKGSETVSELTPIFDPPTQEDLGQEYLKGLTPGISDLLPGFIGRAIELKEKLEWYNSLGEGSGIYFVSETGCIEMGESTPRGGGGDGLLAARAELESIDDEEPAQKPLVEAFNNVEERAQICADDPSAENIEELTTAMGTLVESLNGLPWVQRWSNVDPSEYQGRHSEGEEAADRIQGNAQAVLDIAAEFSDAITDQRAAIRDGDYQPFPAAIATYDASVSNIRSQVPLFWQFTGDSYNVRVENADGKLVWARNMKTGSSGEIEDYELGSADSVDADIVLNESTISDIMDSEDPLASAITSYQNGETHINPHGWANYAKYKALPKLLGSILDVL